MIYFYYRVITRKIVLIIPTEVKGYLKAFKILSNVSCNKDLFYTGMIF